jgi:hypothetical protein
VLTHLGPPSCRRQTSARYARPQVPFGAYGAVSSTSPRFMTKSRQTTDNTGHERSADVTRNRRPRRLQPPDLAGRGQATWIFESLHPAAASPSGSCPRGDGSPRTAHLLAELEPSSPCGSSSFSSTVPPTCHKQRSPAVCSGQSRSLGEGGWAGRTPLTWDGGRARNCMACKGSGVQIPSAPPPHNRRSTVVSRPASARRLLPDPGLGHIWGMTANATASRSAITATTRACIASVMCR